MFVGGSDHSLLTYRLVNEPETYVTRPAARQAVGDGMPGIHVPITCQYRGDIITQTHYTAAWLINPLACKLLHKTQCQQQL